LDKLDYVKIIEAEMYKWSMVKTTHEEYVRNTEQVRIDFLKHGQGVGCRPGKSRWLGGC
jgi:hypothetical protein